MKRLLSIFSIALVALFAVSCGSDEVSENAKPKVTFTFSEEEIGEKTLKVLVTPSDLNATYCLDVIASADLAGKSVATIIDECLNSENFRPRKGAYTLNKSGLKPATAYTVVAFAVSETAAIARKEFTTEASEEPLDPEHFEVKIEVTDITADTAVATATPNGVNEYCFRVITKQELDATGIYNNDLEVFKYVVENPHSNDYITSGPTTLNCKLFPETDYLAVAFNTENWEAVYYGQESVKLFRHAFKTLKGEPVDPNSLFTYQHLLPTSYGFTLEVTPTKGEESFWTYYIWTKESYEETLATESSRNIVMRSYWALNNLMRDAFIDDFNKFMHEHQGQTGSSEISNYEVLNGNTEYVIVMFYMDPEVEDPTVVYDYNYVAVEFKTKERTLPKAELSVSEPIIVKSGLSYDVKFVVKTNEDAILLKVGGQLYANYDIPENWDPNDWSKLNTMFKYGTTMSEDTLATAKTEEGVVISLKGYPKDDYAFFFEVQNSEYTPTQFAVRVTPEMFDNVE